MLKTDIDALTLSAAVAAITVARLTPDTGWTMLVAGVLVTLALWAFSSGERGLWQSVAFAGVAGYALATGILGGLKMNSTGLSQWPATGLWIGLSALFVIVDRARASSPTPRPSFAPAVVPVSVPQPSPTPSSIAAEPAVAPAESVITPAPPVTPAAPPPNAVALPPNIGKPATIYLNITNAGIACLRPVQAEHLGRDFYRIVENTPADEQWEFTTGQIVRCQKRNLSSGRSLVAFEEAPRADKQ